MVNMTVEKENYASLSQSGSMSRLSSAKTRNIEIEYKSGARYHGEVQGNQRSGRGVFTWTDGSRYEGEFVNNKRHGAGEQTWQDASRYEGDFEDDCKHGYGTHVWPSGETYTGSFFKDRRHGKGLYKWPNGNQYYGTFYMDKKEGYGTFTFANGNKFEGLYRNDEREGPGVMTYSDGRRDVGLWSRERIVKLCTNVDGISLELKSHGFHVQPQEHQRFLPKVVTIRQTLDRLGSVNVLPPNAVPQPLVYGYEPSLEVISRSVVSDALPVTCLAADLQSFDEAFFAAASQADAAASHTKGKPKNRGVSNVANPTPATPVADPCNFSDVIAWNCTPSCMSMQSHILRHSGAQRSVQFDVDALLHGKRFGPAGDRGPMEIASERLICAAATGDFDTVVELIDGGVVNVDVADRSGFTALFAATMNCHHNIINYLLNNGADVNKLNDDGVSALAACFVVLYPPDSFLDNAALGCYAEIQELDAEENVDRKTTKTTKKSTQQNPSKIDLKKISEFREQYGSAKHQGAAVDVDGSVPKPTADVNGGINSSSISARPLGTMQIQRTERNSVLLEDDPDEAPVGNDFSSRMSEFESGRPVNGLNVTVKNRQIDKCAKILSSNEMIVGRERSAQHDVWSEGTVRRLALEKSKWKLMQSTMHLLLQRGANPNISSVPMPVLLFATRSGDVNTVQLLLSKGADPNMKLPDSMGGLVALHFACGLHCSEGIHITRMLLDSLANPDARANPDDSYLSHFLEEEWSKDTNDSKLLGGRSPLHVACCRENNHQNACEVVKLLLKHHADPQVLCNGHSPLSLAITRGNDRAVDALLKSGADPNLVHTHGIGSPLCAAVFTENEPRREPDARILLIDRLIQSGANILSSIAIGPRRQLGTVVDFAHYIYNLDPRVAHVPYHALNSSERETFNSRHRLLEHLGHRLRQRAVDYERERMKNDERSGRTSRNPSANFLYTGHGARPDSALLLRKAPQSATSIATSADSDVRKPLFRYCYECGRMVNVRLTPCPRCKEVYYCSKPCLNKAWATVHKDECMRLPRDDKGKRSASSGRKDRGVVDADYRERSAKLRADGLYDPTKSTTDAGLIPSWKEGLPANCYIGNYSFV